MLRFLNTHERYSLCVILTTNCGLNVGAEKVGAEGQLHHSSSSKNDLTEKTHNVTSAVCLNV